MERQAQREPIVTASYARKAGLTQKLGWTLVVAVAAAWAISSLPATAQEDRTAERTQESTATPDQTAESTPQDETAAAPSTQETPAPDQAQPLPDEAGEQQTEPTQTTPEEQPDTADEPAAAATPGPTTAPPAAAAPGVDPASRYGLWVLFPAIVAILLAILTRQVIPALAVAVLVGGYMMVPCLAADAPFASLNKVVAGFRLAAETYAIGAITDPAFGYGHIKIIVFTLLIGFMVGVIGKNGGTEGLVRLVAGKTNSPRRGAVTAWLAGLVVFFDDYANTMIVGPAMQSVFDRVKLSRAKLAYIVDSTAAPVASIALIGTWIGAEIGYIQDGLTTLAQTGTPEFLIDSQGNVMGGMQAFLYSIPYRFYPILAVFLVFLIAVTGRDFGPMKRAERRVLSKIEPDPGPAAPGSEPAKKPRPRWWLGLLPVLVLVGGTVAVLAITGVHAPAAQALIDEVGPNGESVWAQKAWWLRAADILHHSDSYLSIFYGAVFAALAAALLTLVARACSIRDTIDAGLDGMARMFPAMVILVLAWALSAVLQDLKLGNVVVEYLEEQNFPAEWLPLGIFVSAAVISFATGTSWGTMGILCPTTVTISAGLIAGMETSAALTLFYASVGSVLAGAVFGDHCSPISDTTVLSSIASGCRHEEHVWTQIPYALLAAIAAMGLGDVMCSVYGQPWYYGLGTGAVFLLFVVFVIGRKPVASFDLADV
jgi:Na+/H+ antiporter NhaC